MPSPIGHALAGLMIHTLSARDAREQASLPRAMTLSALACAPDLDLILSWSTHAYRHQGEIHGLGAALIAGAAAAAGARLFGLRDPGRWALLTVLAWMSHALFDALSIDTRAPFGPMVFWPLTRATFHAPISIFLDIWRLPTWAATRHNALAIAWELALLVPVSLVLRTRRWQRAASAG
ncbi:MAG: metal-dependent hydrolase [Vicinamibacteria bacterium]|jgi:hypothetical protein|nr:metal-dependent hydrolase [Vicinamibacteria bacterium]